KSQFFNENRLNPEIGFNLLEPNECFIQYFGNASVGINSSSTAPSNFKVANDFVVKPNQKFTVEAIVVDFLGSTTYSPNTVNVSIQEDNNGVPGAMVQSFVGIAASPEQTGTLGGNPRFAITITLPSSIELQGGDTGKNYWFIFSIPTP